MLDSNHLPEYGGVGSASPVSRRAAGRDRRRDKPLSQGLARAAEQLGQGAVNLYDTIYPAFGYHQPPHRRRGASALHWATDTRDPFNSCHDYTSCVRLETDRRRALRVPGGHFVATRRMVY